MRKDDAAADGPLVALADSGGTSLDAPPGRGRWTGNFANALCTEDGAEVEIDAVTHHFVVEPVATRDLIRKVPDRARPHWPRCGVDRVRHVPGIRRGAPP